MAKIATLGPPNTFSDIATQQFIKTQNLNHEIKYFKSLSDTFRAIGVHCEFGVLPIENLSEGYVQVVLDHLLETSLNIIAEYLLPIQFSFVRYSESDGPLTDVFVQFVAYGQCSEFIEQQNNIRVHYTQSNISSLVEAQKKGKGAGAVVPKHALKSECLMSSVVENITNYENNQTRFLVVSTEPCIYQPAVNYKTTLVVKNDNDCPGVLGNIINAFAAQKVNLTSIMSRPTKSQFGQYHFFIDIDGHQQDENIKLAILNIKNDHVIRVLGSYPKA
ncbi:prephenate dehydratase [Psychromonas sp. CNPT3]|uniref:prephenate dehydratase n=1 Tax=Psychromonas sp. CNPT3 TaxID=314282 RepID=UPI00006E8AAC|nr:prephenate dehydratase domain-containing protein [Psychromonas sp. CNPT3]AGH80507.1 prephenate dehydratase [Psychromonas sp. CNPT3]